MSEHDYQRGRRGGACNVSISDWERWKDWKAGYDEWEREQGDEDLERLKESGNDELFRAELRRRWEESERKLATIERQGELFRESERKRKQDASTCWVATAYFGSSRHPCVVRLRNLRAHWLSRPLTYPVMVGLNRGYQMIGRTSFGSWWAHGVGIDAHWCLRKWISYLILIILLRFCHKRDTT